ncbi:MAG: pyroglutamyl-peptidase I [Planctomycetota bacterium]|jgi:pyroglutamyl-peptidase
MLLLTGFEPFGGMPRNPTGEIARLLGGEPGVTGAVLPVEYQRIGGALRELLDQSWDAVVLMGVAVQRPVLTIEKVAINYGDPARPDNAGYCPDPPELVEDGPDAYFSTLPIERLLAALQEEQVPAAISYTAGPYLCNASMYWARHLLDDSVPCGFIHMPPTGDLAQGVEPMEFDTQVRGIRRVLAELA